MKELFNPSRVRRAAALAFTAVAPAVIAAGACATDVKMTLSDPQEAPGVDGDIRAQLEP